MLKEQIVNAFRFLLEPLVRFLIKHGVSWAEFAETAKEAYVAVARADYGIQGRPTNNSRVAMLTGLSRREVASVRDRLLGVAADVSPLRGNRISAILSGWHRDPEFTNSDGTPANLPETGRKGSIESLLRRYAGDLPHSAVRKELGQRGLIEELPDGTLRVLRRDYVYSKLDPEIVRRMSTALHDHAATLVHNLAEENSGSERFEAMADNACIPRSKADEFRALVEQKGLEFLQEIDAWLGENATDITTGAGTHTIRLGVGVYLVHDDSKRGLET